MSKNKKGSDESRRNKGPWNPVDRSAASDGDIQRVHEEIVNEKESPREGYSPIPILLVFLISSLTVFSAIYIVHRSDDFDPMGFNEARRRFDWAELEDTDQAAVDPVLKAGQAVYTQCSACHQATGQGLPGAFPPLDGTEWVNGNKGRLISVVMYGMMGPIEVKGQTYNGMMPNLNLQDEEIASVLTYVRQAWSNSSDAVSVDEVASVRSRFGQRSFWSPDELTQEFPENGSADSGSVEADTETEATSETETDIEPEATSETEPDEEAPPVEEAP